jgi:hypothetical protein
VSPVRVDLPDRHPIAGPVRDFLADLRNAGRSPHTVRGYRGDLAQFAQNHASDVDQVDITTLRAYFSAIEDRASSTRARKQAAIAAFLRWCHRHGLGLSWHTLGGHFKKSRPLWATLGTDVAGGYQQHPRCPHIETKG